MKTDTVMAREAYPECSVPRMQRLGGVVAKGGWRGVEILVEGATGNLQTTLAP
jgi:hypothetical protein